MIKQWKNNSTWLVIFMVKTYIDENMEIISF